MNVSLKTAAKIVFLHLLDKFYPNIYEKSTGFIKKSIVFVNI